MSPLLLRRYRADRLLREQFELQRGRVIDSVSARLRRAGVALDRDDLEAAYAQAWQGLHAAVLDGQQIVNPVGWLAVVAGVTGWIGNLRYRTYVNETPGVNVKLVSSRS